MGGGRVTRRRESLPPSAFETIATEIEALILLGELAPGDRLPSEAELSAKYAVGRSTVREALRVLSSRDLIFTTRGPGGGSIVSLPNAASVSGRLEASLSRLSAGAVISVESLLEVRRMIEIPAAGMAARRSRPEDIEELRAQIGSASLRDAESILRSNREFHRALLHATGNELLEIVEMPVFRVLGTKFDRDRVDASYWTDIHADHVLLLEAVESSDPVAAERIAGEHITRLQQVYLTATVDPEEVTGE